VKTSNLTLGLLSSSGDGKMHLLIWVLGIPLHVAKAIKAPAIRMSPRSVTGKCAARNSGDEYTEWSTNAQGGDSPEPQ
jgi:hypothetical protein